MMKTFAVKLKKDTSIEGVEYPANFHVGALTSEVGPLTLLGLVQFKHATLEEIVDGPDEGDASDEDTSEDGVDGDEPVVETVVEASGDAGDDTDKSDTESDAKSNAEGNASDAPATGIASFIAIGLDQKTAEALVVSNKITTVEELARLLDDPEFDLMDLEEIGAVRAEKIKAVFLPDQK